MKFYAIILTIISALIRNSVGQVALEALAQLISDGARHYESEPDDQTNLLAEYDFIIVGAGSAGCVLANRLSENRDWNILLIEAGRSEIYLADTPLFVQYIQATPYNWNYKTVPSDNYCLGLENRECKFPRGKIVGGSSVLNYMIYTRGFQNDYDNWAKLENRGWSWYDVLPYFKKIENFQIDNYRNSSIHRNDGRIIVSYAPFKTKIADAFIGAAQQAGINYVDYNGATNQIGVSRVQLSMKEGVRESASREYLHPIKNRINFHFKKQSHVSKIIIDPKTKRALGVEFYQYGVKYEIRATKEVIVSAGAINSPQLLMLSGIGPKRHLTNLGIPVLKNLKVGYNLMDHSAIGGLTFTIDKPYSLTYDQATNSQAIIDYFLNRKGPITLPGGSESIVFHDSENPENPNGFPDIELLQYSGSIASDPILRYNLNIRQDLYDLIFKPLENRHAFNIVPVLLRPKSRGRITLHSANYKDKPLIYPNYYSHPDDIRKIVSGVHLIFNITRQKALKHDLGAQIHTIPIPDCAAKNQFGSDAYWECLARHFTFTVYHQSGTCKMGPPSDKRAVVDPRLRVYGIQGLRVIDASIMPEIPAAHTNVPTFMIAEKGADMIKEDWGYKD